MTVDPREALVGVVAAAEAATPGDWDVGDGKANGAALHIYCADGWALASTRMEYTCIPPEQDHANAALIAAACNFAKNEAPALLARLDAAERDAARLDYIERTFSGMTNRERYLPVQMIWGKGCNGRTLREACDKYMNRSAALSASGGAVGEGGNG